MSKVAAIQMASGPNLAANLMEAQRLIADAAFLGAQLVVLPENFALMGEKETDKLQAAELEGTGPIQRFLSEQASKHRIWMVGGTIPIKGTTANKVRAASLVFDDKGKQVARYDKIHLFDVSLPDVGDRYEESETIEAGDHSLVLDTPFGKLGVAVCYDLRFPELFRTMVGKGMEILALPSAFTARTGKAHWDILVRARSIENLCYGIASNQGGFHLNGRETYGHSMIVDPWGTVLGQCKSGSAVVVADIDHEQVVKTRKLFPVLDHRFLFCEPG